ncbi:hypothetical protein P7K49_014954 [Saguinus oedipus]|uniref:Uncharacterized protein n=1 Tax=Saguinus oedipus TaxID=9490 RepID=A0ABQ9V7W9_SAGOE|nr:hypothetical protein P7K49_014954 [Saguinus oedipus]
MPKVRARLRAAREELTDWWGGGPGDGDGGTGDKRREVKGGTGERSGEAMGGPGERWGGVWENLGEERGIGGDEGEAGPGERSAGEPAARPRSPCQAGGGGQDVAAGASSGRTGPGVPSEAWGGATTS